MTTAGHWPRPHREQIPRDLPRAQELSSRARPGGRDLSAPQAIASTVSPTSIPPARRRGHGREHDDFKADVRVDRSCLAGVPAVVATARRRGFPGRRGPSQRHPGPSRGWAARRRPLDGCRVPHGGRHGAARSLDPGRALVAHRPAWPVARGRERIRWFHISGRPGRCHGSTTLHDPGLDQWGSGLRTWRGLVLSPGVAPAGVTPIGSPQRRAPLLNSASASRAGAPGPWFNRGWLGKSGLRRPTRSMNFVERGEDVSGDTAAVGYFKTVLRSPVPDRPGLFLTVGRCDDQLGDLPGAV